MKNRLGSNCVHIKLARSVWKNLPLLLHNFRWINGNSVKSLHVPSKYGNLYVLLKDISWNQFSKRCRCTVLQCGNCEKFSMHRTITHKFHEFNALITKLQCMSFSRNSFQGRVNFPLQLLLVNEMYLVCISEKFNVTKFF